MVSPPSAVRWRGSTSCAADLVAVLGDGLVPAPKRANARGAGDAPGGFSRSQPRFSAPVGTRRRRRRSTVRFPSRSSFPPGWRQAREHGHVWGCFQARGRGAPRAHRQLQQETPALGGHHSTPSSVTTTREAFLPPSGSSLPPATSPVPPQHVPDTRKEDGTRVPAVSLLLLLLPRLGAALGSAVPVTAASSSRARAVPRCSGIPCPPASELSAPKLCHVSGPGS